MLRCAVGDRQSKLCLKEQEAGAGGLVSGTGQQPLVLREGNRDMYSFQLAPASRAGTEGPDKSCQKH